MSLQTLKEITTKSEHTVKQLSTKLDLFKKIYGQQKSINEKEQIKKLTQDNEKLREDIDELKFSLNYYKVQNGAKSIPLPKRSAVVKTEVIEPVNEPQINKAAKTKDELPAKKDTKAKKEPKKSNAKTSSKEEGSGDKPINISRLEMRVGKIIHVEKHPDADTLYVEKVDLGEEKPRTIVSGIVKFVTVKEMQNRLAIFMCNLKPAKMRGILSEGMIMCASTPEDVQPLNPPLNAAIGDKVECEEFEGQPDKQLNPKRKIWEQIQPDLLVDSEGVACYKGKPLVIKGKGACKPKSMKNCPIK